MTRLGRNNRINNPISLSLLRGHEKITVTILLDLINGLARVFADVGVEEGTDEEDFLGLDLDVGGLALGAA